MTNELLQVFPTPVHITKYEESMEKEFKFVKNIEYSSNGNNGNYKSKNTSVLKCKELKSISDFIKKQLDVYCEKIISSKQKLVPTISWMNKNPKGSRHHGHIHPNSITSGVFYFAINNTAPIQFHKNDQWGLKLSIDKYNIFNSETFAVPMKTGELILFPSNTKHSVPINKSEEERFSLSFNTFVPDSIIGSKETLTYLNTREINYAG